MQGLWSERHCEAGRPVGAEGRGSQLRTSLLTVTSRSKNIFVFSIGKIQEPHSEGEQPDSSVGSNISPALGPSSSLVNPKSSAALVMPYSAVRTLPRRGSSADPREVACFSVRSIELCLLVLGISLTFHNQCCIPTFFSLLSFGLLGGLQNYWT